MPESRPPTFLCITTYEKGQDFMRECKRRGCRVFLLTAEKLRDADWPRESLDDTFYLPADLPLADTVQELARDELVSALPMLRRLPHRIDRLSTMAERGDLRARVSLFSTAEDVRVVTLLVNRVLLAFLGAFVGVISVVLLGIRGGPDFAGQTSLYEFFGYFGLFCSTVLVMRVLVAILRDGVN